MEDDMRNAACLTLPVLLVLLSRTLACQSNAPHLQPVGNPPGRDYRTDMRAFVRAVSARARKTRPGFIVVPQNGTELVTRQGAPGDAPALAYLNAIDGIGREDLWYGYDRDDLATPAGETGRLRALLDIAQSQGVRVLVTDYCRTRRRVDDSYARNKASGYISFAADRRALDDIPAYPDPPFQANNRDTARLGQASNFLYLLDQSRFPSPEAFADALAAARHDLLIVDAYFNGDRPLTAAQVSRLKKKPGGGRRLVLAYMSLGEAENYRPYWNPQWTKSPPAWLADENPDWPGNYKVRYWDPAWQSLILGKGGYLEEILRQGFDGVYLDIIDAFEFFESR
jgi:cysteinyl-tRNA synthetase